MPAALRNFLSSLADPVYAAVRITTGLMFLTHGTSKLWDWPAGFNPERFTKHWWAGVLEVVLGAMVMLGIQVRLAAFLAAGTMAVAYWTEHFDPAKPLPLQNGGTLAVLYCWIFLVLATRGPGKFTLWPKRGG